MWGWCRRCKQVGILSFCGMLSKVYHLLFMLFEWSEVKKWSCSYVKVLQLKYHQTFYFDQNTTGDPEKGSIHTDSNRCPCVRLLRNVISNTAVNRLHWNEKEIPIKTRKDKTFIKDNFNEIRFFSLLQVTPVVPMSLDTWSMSFAKYLELRFHGNVYTRRQQPLEGCTHSLHHDHYQYFGCKQIVTSFK